MCVCVSLAVIGDNSWYALSCCFYTSNYNVHTRGGRGLGEIAEQKENKQDQRGGRIEGIGTRRELLIGRLVGMRW